MVNPLDLLRPEREITGMSAVLLPCTDEGAPDWDAFEALLDRTLQCGLVPAVDMDTGYVDRLGAADYTRVLDCTAEVTHGREFVAGAFVADEPGDPWNVAATLDRVEAICSRGGTPVVFPNHGLSALPGPAWVEAHRRIGDAADRFIAFELSPAFAPFGRICDLETYAALLDIPTCIGAKHSSLERLPEWERLELRDRTRPDFLVLTGNDLAIDMVMYGSDYLLGLSAFAPRAFARRDRLWAEGDARFHQLNDVLQALGAFAFRDPVPAYKHSAAQFLHLRGWIPSATPLPGSARRPDSDVEVLRALLERLEAEVDGP